MNTARPPRRGLLTYTRMRDGTVYIGRVFLIVDKTPGPALYVGANTAMGLTDAALNALRIRYGENPFMLELHEL